MTTIAAVVPGMLSACSWPIRRCSDSKGEMTRDPGPRVDRAADGNRSDMAQYEHLPIFRKALALSVYLEDRVRQFSRYHKYTIGTQLREGALGVLSLIIRANNQGEWPARVATLEDLRLRLEELKTLCYLAKEIKAFPNFDSFAHASELVVDLARQNEGWLKQQKSRSAATSQAHSRRTAL